jgi:hypothetical protein
MDRVFLAIIASGLLLLVATAVILVVSDPKMGLLYAAARR